ncbi:hypothetical protein [Agromyces salentinus]|nr:hypothetical protein [Agromyces salentinus]
MYGIPAGESFAFVEGHVLEQLCFGRDVLILKFDGNVSITVEGALGITPPAADESIVDDARDIVSVLVGLIADTVLAAEVNDARSFSMTFSLCHIVRLIDSSERYESFQVRDGERLIVV